MVVRKKNQSRPKMDSAVISLEREYCFEEERMVNWKEEKKREREESRDGVDRGVRKGIRDRGR